MKKKIYIAGKVTGEDQQECIDKFQKVKEQIEALGFEAVNPLEVVGDWKTPWNKAMRMCIAKLTECDAIAMIPDWFNSKGAKIEYEVSKLLAIPSFRATTFGLEDLKGKAIGLVFLFKYDLKGNLKLFEISEGELNQDQIKWLFSHFPAQEVDITKVWMKEKKYTKVFVIEKSPADLSFDSLWNLYGYKESRKDAEKSFNKLNEEQKIKCFIQVPKYIKKLARSSTAQALLATWINKERYNDEY
jgi:hypothetical protein